MRCVSVDRVQKTIKIVATGTILFFLGLSLRRDWRGVSDYIWNAQPWLLSLSFIFMLAQWFMTALEWKVIVRSLGGELGLRKGMRIYFLSNLGRYIPGSVWYVLGRAYLGEREEVSAAVVSTSIVMENALATVSGTFLSALASPLFLSQYGRGSLYAGMAIVALGLIFLHPSLMSWLLNLLARLLRSSSGVTPVGGYLATLGLLLGYTFIWAFRGIAFFMLLYSLCPIPLAWLPTIGGILAASYIVGFLVPFAPGGLGVREGVIVLLLGQYVPLPAAAAAAILLRIWSTLSELIWAGVSMAL